MIAAMRARESSRDDRLFYAPFAAFLAGEAAFQRIDPMGVDHTGNVSVHNGAGVNLSAADILENEVPFGI